MIRFEFENGFALVRGEKVELGNGINLPLGANSDSEGAFVRTAEGFIISKSAYLMLSEEESYIDLCNDFYNENGKLEECVVDQHLPILSITADEFDQTFIENFLDDYYSNDNVAYLDDLCCALDNEVDNICHWNTIRHEIDLDERDDKICRYIYLKNQGAEKELNEEFGEDYVCPIDEEHESDFGCLIALKYGAELRERITEYETELMDRAIEDLCSILEIE